MSRPTGGKQVNKDKREFIGVQKRTMRDSNHRCVLLNRPSVTITSAVYDRRGLDCISEIPLINSLNHLTYLTSNSAKVRETVANDGALVRLVSILHDCNIPLSEISEVQLTDEITPVERIQRQRKLAMVAWKWTLAFQCLVLTGTRGTEHIRKQVVSSGVIPILATVLDNYLLLEKNYDFMAGGDLDFDFKRTVLDGSISFEELTSSCGDEGLVEKCRELRTPSVMQLNTDFSSLWRASLGPGSNEDLEVDTYDNIAVSVPRTFIWGKIAPKADDVIWSLQLLAFISKYTHMKPYLQRVHLVKSLSLRTEVSTVRKHLEQAFDISPLKISTEEEAKPVQNESDVAEEPKERTVDHNDPYLIEMEAFCKNLNGSGLVFHNSRHCSSHREEFIDAPHRVIKMAKIEDKFSTKWDYDVFPKVLDEGTWNHIIGTQYLNLFPLVERFTVKKENERDMTYWSSVVMRNSCRKNETTGVRQCANFACGKWEDYPKRFAKCRRCKRTKYCSRECQLQSWNFHRYWCQEVTSSSAGNGSVNNGSERNTPHEATSTAGSAVENATTDIPSATNEHSAFDATGSNTDNSQHINNRNTITGET